MRRTHVGQQFYPHLTRCLRVSPPLLAHAVARTLFYENRDNPSASVHRGRHQRLPDLSRLNDRRIQHDHRDGAANGTGRRGSHDPREFPEHRPSVATSLKYFGENAQRPLPPVGPKLSYYMKQRLEEGRFSDRGEGLGTVTEEMVYKRAQQIAVINGRSQNNVLDSDIEQSRRELQGEERLNPPSTRAEQLPEGERWSVPPASVGRKAETVPAPDEQTFAEKLVEEGVADAEHDQEIEATKAAARRDNE